MKIHVRLQNRIVTYRKLANESLAKENKMEHNDDAELNGDLLLAQNLIEF